MNKTSNKYWVLCICLALVLSTLLVFWRLNSYEFINYDDDKYVTENPYVNAGLSRDSIIWAFTTPHGGTSYWHPLTWLSHMLDCQLFGLNARWHHLTNLLLHIANTLLLFIVFRKMTGALWKSAFVAAVFALHPLHIESVAWISERKDVLSTFFGLLSILAYLGYVKRPAIGRYLLVFIVFALALMSKPMLVTLPFVLLLLDFWPLERFQRNTFAVCRIFFEKVPLIMLSLILCAVTFFAQRSLGVVAKLGSIPFGMRLANAFISYIKYIWKMLWPLKLAVLYPHPGSDLPMWKAVIAAIFLFVVTALIIRHCYKHKYLLTGWFWYLGTLVPVIGFVQVGAQEIADRYTYMTMTGLFIIIAWGLSQLLSRLRFGKVVLGTSALIVLLALSICTWFQQKYWQNSKMLFEHALQVTSENYIMHDSLANLLASEGKYNLALKHYRKAILIKPDFAAVHYNLARTFQSQDLLDEAISSYRRALSIRPSYADAHNNLGNIFRAKGKLNEAISHYQQALQDRPDFAEVHYNLANAFKSLGQLDEAVSHYYKAIELQPADSDMYNNLANTLRLKGKIDDAIDFYQKSLQIDPDYIPARNNLGIVLFNEGRLDEALEHFRYIVRLNPDSPSALNFIAQILIEHPDFKLRNAHSATDSARRAAQLTNYQNSTILQTLAAAYAAGGQFDKAAETARKALTLAVANQNHELAGRIRRQLQSYNKRQP